jgi:hypothetical protein
MVVTTRKSQKFKQPEAGQYFDPKPLIGSRQTWERIALVAARLHASSITPS